MANGIAPPRRGIHKQPLDFDDLRTDGELAYDWEDAVLRELLPTMLPGHRSHAARLTALERAAATFRGDPIASQHVAAYRRLNDHRYQQLVIVLLLIAGITMVMPN